MSEIVGRTVADPNDLYQRQQDASVATLAQHLGTTVEV